MYVGSASGSKGFRSLKGCLAWGVHPVVAPGVLDLEDAIRRALRLARDEGFGARGESLVVTAGIPVGQAGTTNTLRVVTL